MKILILGANGQVGRCLSDQLKKTSYDVFYASRQQIDIADFEDTKAKILDISPDIVVNASAYTAVDKAEQNKEKANKINHLAVANIGEICNYLGNWLIHISTDYVFDGNSEVPYKEDDYSNPQSTYGETKLKGEFAIKNSGCKSIVLRTSWLFSEYGNNFLKTMLQLAAENDNLNIVGDQKGCPTYAQDLALAIVTIISKLNTLEGIEGTYHFSGNSACSWYEFAKEIFTQQKKYSYTSTPYLNAVSSKKYLKSAKRPKFSVLDNNKIKEKFDISPSDWKMGVSSALKKIIAVARN